MSASVVTDFLLCLRGTHNTFRLLVFLLFFCQPCPDFPNCDLVFLTVCYYHVTHAFQSESTLYSCLNVKELLARSRRKIWSLSDCKWTRTHNQLVRRRTLNYSASLTKWLSVSLRTKWLWVRVQLQSPGISDFEILSIRRIDAVSPAFSTVTSPVVTRLSGHVAAWPWSCGAAHGDWPWDFRPLGLHDRVMWLALGGFRPWVRMAMCSRCLVVTCGRRGIIYPLASTHEVKSWLTCVDSNCYGIAVK